MMQLPWSADANIVEIGAADGAIGARLIHAGFTRYLAVSSSARVAAKMVASYPQLDRKVAPSKLAGRVRRNNADVLILNGRAALAVASPRAVRHAEWVVLPLRARPLSVVAVVAGGLGWLVGIYNRPALVSFGGSGRRRAVALHVRRRHTAGVRRYVPFGLGVSGFFQRLNSQACRYAVLRWFESLPDVAEGEDLDLLVEDQSLESVREALDSGPGIQAVDLYSVSGLPGSDYRGLPYYPPSAAEQLLIGAVDHCGLCKAPAPEHHFLSLAYHALYHKGLKSGVPAGDEERPEAKTPEHDYAATLRELGRRAGYEGPITLEALDQHLEARGWRPSHDSLSRLSRHNSWLRGLVDRPSSDGGDQRVLATWTKSGRRAKIEVVEHTGRLVVKKTFKPHMRRFWQHETEALRDLSRTVPQSPPLIAAEDGWLMIPLYEDVLKYRRSSGKLLPLGVAKEAVAALRRVYEAGYAIIDASVDNVLVDRREGLKMFDFEFCYKYPQRPARFEESFDIAGCPPGFEGEQPIQGGNSYERNWRPYIGLTLASLLHDPTWLQHVKRTAYYSSHAHRYLPRLLRHYARGVVSLLISLLMRRRRDEAQASWFASQTVATSDAKPHKAA